MTSVLSIDPRTGDEVEVVAEESTATEVAAACEAAANAAPELAALGRAGRARMLRGMADALEGDGDAILDLADRETALGREPRLVTELARTCFQLRLFADVLDEGSYLEATIDHPGTTPAGPRPDLRRMLHPLGPVGVFGASNFPLAFSVPGGDTASALAAGCPVVVKAHPLHPATSQRCFERLASVDAPAGTLALVHGQEAGLGVVQHPKIRAVGFTGSLRGGRALFDAASARPEPIPFYGELGSLNPLVVTRAAAAERAEEIAAGFVGSMTMGVGQFCTKPGLAIVPSDESTLLDALATAATDAAGGWMLSGGIRDACDSGVERLRQVAGVRELAASTAEPSTGFWARPELLTVPATQVDGPLLSECFGPVAVIATYDDASQLLALLDRLEGSLTASVHLGTDELPQQLIDALVRRAGRIVYNGFPTGVAVAWAMHHGGPYPSTTSALHTSVGTTAIRRWLRPVSYQAAPEALLPEELRDDYASIPRRIDGHLVLPAE